MNNVNLSGRLSKEPEYRVSESGKCFCKFIIAVKPNHIRDDNTDETSFFNCVCFGYIAEFVNNYVKKGRLVSLSGELKNRSWTNQDGTKGYITEIIVEYLDCEKINTNVTTQAQPVKKKKPEFVDLHPEIDLATYDPFAEEN